MSLSSLFRFKRSNEGLEVKNMSKISQKYEIKHFAKCLFMEHKSIKFLQFLYCPP